MTFNSIQSEKCLSSIYYYSVGIVTEIERRVFIVGCPRSGTTLVQSILAANPHVVSFPESHFFAQFRFNSRIKRFLRLIPKSVATRFSEYLVELKINEKKNYLSCLGRSYSKSIDTFKHLLDECTHLQHGTVWIEKTPDHVLHIELIKKYITDAYFIHVLRDGRDVVASLYEVTRHYPNAWDGPWSIDKCVNWWHRSVSESMKYLNNSDHFHLFYEGMIRYPQDYCKQLCQWINIPYSEQMIAEYTIAANSVILPNETWKENTKRKIHKNAISKFDKVFSQRQKEYISEKIDHLTDQLKIKTIFAERIFSEN